MSQIVYKKSVKNAQFFYSKAGLKPKILTIIISWY